MLRILALTFVLLFLSQGTEMTVIAYYSLYPLSIRIFQWQQKRWKLAQQNLSLKLNPVKETSKCEVSLLYICYMLYAI